MVNTARHARPLLLVLVCVGCGKNAAESGPGRVDRPTSVAAATVRREDVPIYLEGLGSVTAYYTVTVKAQVDGRIDKVLYREGQEVRRGDVLAQIDPRPFEIQLHQAQAALARDTATLRNNKLNLERNKALREKNLIPQQQLDDQQSLVDQGEASILADQTQVDNANLQLVYAHITSPIDGRTGVRLVDPGNIVHAADPNGIVVITQLDPIAVLFTLPEDDLPEVAKALAAGPLTVEAFSRDGKLDLGEGKVTLIDNQINQSTGTMRVKAVFANKDRALWPNQFVKIRLRLQTLSGAAVVPAAVVQRGPQGSFAYVIGADKTVAARPVEVSTLQGDTAVIAHGLEAGEQVVLDGQYMLRPGAKVSVRAADKAEHAADAKPNTGGESRP